MASPHRRSTTDRVHRTSPAFIARKHAAGLLAGSSSAKGRAIASGDEHPKAIGPPAHLAGGAHALAADVHALLDDEAGLTPAISEGRDHSRGFVLGQAGHGMDRGGAAQERRARRQLACPGAAIAAPCGSAGRTAARRRSGSARVARRAGAASGTAGRRRSGSGRRCGTSGGTGRASRSTRGAGRRSGGTASRAAPGAASARAASGTAATSARATASGAAAGARSGTGGGTGRASRGAGRTGGGASGATRGTAGASTSTQRQRRLRFAEMVRRNRDWHSGEKQCQERCGSRERGLERRAGEHRVLFAHRVSAQQTPERGYPFPERNTQPAI
jgi:hypothetical protein